MYIHEIVLMNVTSRADRVHKHVLRYPEKIKHTETSDDEKGSPENLMAKIQYIYKHFFISHRYLLTHLLTYFFFIIRAWSISPRCTAACRLIVRPLSPRDFRRSHFHRQMPPHPYDARDPSSERWNCGRECWLVILPKCRLPRYI